MRIAAVRTVSAVPRRIPDRPDDESAFFPVLGYFRETNAECLRIRSRLVEAVKVSGTSDPLVAAYAFEETRQVILDEIAGARHRANAIEAIQSSDPGTSAWYAREFVQVRNGWDDLSRLWSSPGRGEESGSERASLAEMILRSQQTIKVLDSVIFICACQTIADELDNYLKNYRIGRCLDFIATFKDQLPNEELTRAVLATLAPQSGIVSGLIDLPNARVIKADQRVWRQVMSVVAILVTVGLGFLLIAVTVHLGTWFQFDTAEWQVNQSQWTALNGAYLLVLLGVLGHWILDRVKQNRAGSDVTPLSEWLMWLHVNEVPIMVRIASVWLLVGLGVAFKTFNLAK